MKTTSSGSAVTAIAFFAYLLILQFIHGCVYEWARQTGVSADFISFTDIVCLLLLFGPVVIVLVKRFKNVHEIKSPVTLCSWECILKLAVYFLIIILLYKNCSVGDYCIEVFWKQFDLEPTLNTRILMSSCYYIIDSMESFLYLLFIPLLAVHSTKITAKGIKKRNNAGHNDILKQY